MAKCRECKKQYDRDYWEKTKNRRNQRKRENSEKIKSRNRKFVIEHLKTHPCAECGEADPVVLEFDHLRDKTISIADAVGDCWSLKRISTEIEKCQVLCANCHRRKTAKQFEWYSGIS